MSKPNSRNRSPRLRAHGSLSLAILLVDQATKAFARQHLSVGALDAVTVALGPLQGHLVLKYNLGMAYGVGAGLPPLLNILLTVVAPILLCAFLGWSVIRAPLTRSVWGPILAVAGGLSNVLDKLTSSQGVTDFLKLSVGPLSTATFNVADVVVTVGVVLMLAGATRPATRPATGLVAGAEA